MELPKDDSVELWHLVLAVEGRRQLQEAITQGLLESPESAVRYFGVVSPIRADSIGVDRTSGRFVVRIRDAQAKQLHVSFPASPDSVMSSSSGSWPVRSAWHYYSAGDSQDRLLMTLLSVALGVEPADKGDAASGVYSTQHRQDVAALLKLLTIRTARILESDARE
jgi:hypothetical protein